MNARAETTKSQTPKRLLGTASLIVLGAAITVGTWIGGQHGLAVSMGIFYAVAGLVVFVWSGRQGDIAALLRVDGDERQRQLDIGATAIAGLAMILCCIVGAVVDLARGGSGGPWVFVCAVGGTTYAIALTVIRRRH
jgi:hypothetical protein